MDTPMQTTPTAAASGASKPLWIAIGVLGAAVLAMGGTLAYKEFRPQPAAEAVAAAPAAEVAGAPDKAAAPGAATTAEAGKPGVMPVPAPTAKTPAPRPVAHNTPRPADASAYPSGSVAPVAKSTPAREVCLSCGTVDAVTPIERKGQTNGTGAVAGGVLGAIVGNQVGHGSGRAAATVLGALGGGYAGNAIEKNVKKETVYQVRVRMEDGSVRTLEQKIPPAVGARVTVDGNTLRSSDGVTYSPAPAPVQAPVQSTAPTGSAY